jgi:methionine-rich copper-binding protein CopC
MKSNISGFSFLGTLIVIIILAGLGGAGWYTYQKNSDKKNESTAQTTQQEPAKTESLTFTNPKKGAHFETSTPAHGSTLAAAPAQVVIDFNFDLASNSSIDITKDGKDYGTGTTTVDTNKLAMRRQLDQAAPDGIYTVKYNGCWPDKTCHEGTFQFAIDRTQLTTYQDLRNQAEVTIKLSNSKFNSMKKLLGLTTTLLSIM